MEGEEVRGGRISGVCVMMLGEGVFRELGGSTGKEKGEGEDDSCLCPAPIPIVRSGEVSGEAGKGTLESILLRNIWCLVADWVDHSRNGLKANLNPNLMFSYSSTRTRFCICDILSYSDTVLTGNSEKG